jgi:cystathionine beta-lyase
VALLPGHEFGAHGRGYARLNNGTSDELLSEAVRRIAAASSPSAAAAPPRRP